MIADTAIVASARHSDTSIAEFLDEDAASIVGNGGLEMGPSGLTFTGYIYISAGAHEISVASDDGFTLMLDGVDFCDFPGKRGSGETTRVAEFEGGLN